MSIFIPGASKYVCPMPKPINSMGNFTCDNMPDFIMDS